MALTRVASRANTLLHRAVHIGQGCRARGMACVRQHAAHFSRPFAAPRHGVVVAVAPPVVSIVVNQGVARKALGLQVLELLQAVAEAVLEDRQQRAASPRSASATASTSASEPTSGFSQTTCLPAASACSIRRGACSAACRCRPCRASGLASERRRSDAVVARRTPNCGSRACSLSASRSHTALISKRSGSSA